MYQGTETEAKYLQYNKKFQAWFDDKYGSKEEVQEVHARDFVSEYVSTGKDSNMVIAALRFRFNFCEKKEFSFKGLRKGSKSKKPHKVISSVELGQIFKASQKDLGICVAFHLLYDLAARAQDLVVLEYGQLISEGGAKWKMKKT